MKLDYKKIKKVIKEKGYRHDFIAKKMNISKLSLSYKLNCKIDFWTEEIKMLSDILDLTPQEKMEIFLK